MDSFEVEVDPIERFEFARRHGGRRQVSGRILVKQSVRQSRRTLGYCSGRCNHLFSIIGTNLA